VEETATRKISQLITDLQKQGYVQCTFLQALKNMFCSKMF
jgi:hypothetical protein